MQISLEEILQRNYDIKEPFDKNGELTPEGLSAYNKLIAVLADVGDFFNTDMNNWISEFDRVVDEDKTARSINIEDPTTWKSFELGEIGKTETWFESIEDLQKAIAENGLSPNLAEFDYDYIYVEDWKGDTKGAIKNKMDGWKAVAYCPLTEKQAEQIMDDKIWDTLDLDRQFVVAEQKDINEMYEAETKYNEAKEYLLNHAKLSGDEHYEIMDDSMTYQRGLCLVVYKDESKEEELYSLTVNMDEFGSTSPSRTQIDQPSESVENVIINYKGNELVELDGELFFRQKGGELEKTYLSGEPEHVCLRDFFVKFMSQPEIDALGDQLFFAMTEKERLLSVIDLERGDVTLLLTPEQRNAIAEAYLENDSITGLMEQETIDIILEDAGVKDPKTIHSNLMPKGL